MGPDVRLSGWCPSHPRPRRPAVQYDSLRDHYGLTQCVVDPDLPAFREAEQLRSEFVIRIDGKVRKRPAGTENPEMPTGLVEVYGTEIEVLGPAGDLPLPVFGDQPYPEDTRLRYPFLDLRREKLHQNIMLRGFKLLSLASPTDEERQGFFEFQDADPHRVEPRRRNATSSCLRVCTPASSTPLLHSAATVQATPDDGGFRSLFPDRALFP